MDESGREPVTPTWAQRKQKWAGRCYTLLVLASLSVLGRGSRVRVRVQVHWGEACFDCVEMQADRETERLRLETEALGRLGLGRLGLT